MFLFCLQKLVLWRFGVWKTLGKIKTFKNLKKVALKRLLNLKFIVILCALLVEKFIIFVENSALVMEEIGF